MTKISPGARLLGQQHVERILDAEQQDAQPDLVEVEDTLAGLAKLREPFAADQIEKLPKPMWKGAWDGRKAATCPICHGYHVLENAIHLDYCGHASATNRLLDADPFWTWEPMALTAQGTPLYSDGGLWIRLTVCGVTRLGFGDGKNPKEIIGDAIRNAAMRFGVALDLWSKINLHEGINPGDGQTQASRTEGDRGAQQGSGDSRGQGRGRAAAAEVADTAPAANQDALDALASVCDEHGYDRRAMGAMFRKFADEHPEGQLTTTGLIDADSDVIILFADELIRRAMADPRESAGGPESVDTAGGAVRGSDVPEAADAPAESVPSDDSGTSDAAADDEGDEGGSTNPEEMF